MYTLFVNETFRTRYAEINSTLYLIHKHIFQHTLPARRWMNLNEKRREVTLENFNGHKTKFQSTQVSFNISRRQTNRDTE